MRERVRERETESWGGGESDVKELIKHTILNHHALESKEEGLQRKPVNTLQHLTQTSSYIWLLIMDINEKHEE